MRAAFVSAIEEVAGNNPDVMLLTADLGYKLYDKFAESYPGRFINVGVAEANMVSIAAGLAIMGKHPFVYSIGPFATLRPLEQIRMDICYHNLPVVITAVGGGFAYGSDGPSHHTLEDISIMRSLPEMTVICPCDPVEVKMALPEIHELKKPVYLRLGRGGEKIIHNKPFKFKIGKGMVIREGNDCTIIVTGGISGSVIESADILEQEGINSTVILMPTIKPIDKDLILKYVEKGHPVITVEEHFLDGGLGSAVAEVIAQSGTGIKFEMIGIKKFVHCGGNQEYLKKVAGIDSGSICKRIRKTLKGK